MFINSLPNLASDYRSPWRVSIGTTDVFPAQAGIQCVCRLILQGRLDSSFRWNDDVCHALGWSGNGEIPDGSTAGKSAGVTNISIPIHPNP